MAKPKTTNLKRWTQEEIDFLKNNFATMMHKELGEALGRTEQAVRAKCFELSLYKKAYPWTDKELQFLIDNYNNMTYRQIGKELGRSLDAVRSKAALIGLIKDSYCCDYEYFNTIDTEDKAYWLGFIFADGWTYISKTTKAGCTGLELQIDDIGHLRKFNRSIGGNYKVEKRIRSAERLIGHLYNNKNAKHEDKEIETCYIRVFSRIFTDYVIGHGAVPNKSLIKNFPTTVPNNLVRHFIRGYFDGNGSISTNNCLRFSFYSGSKAFMNKLKDILTANGIQTGSLSVTQHNNNLDVDTCFCLRVYSNYENSLRFYNYLYNGAHVYLDRKYFKATSEKKSIERKLEKVS